MQYIILYTLLLTRLLGDSVVTINNQSYTLNDFYQEYGKKEWHDAKKNQQKELINDFINKHVATLEGTAIGLNNKPDITKKLYDRNHSALVSTTYEELVAKPLISEEKLINTKKYIVEERLLSHILIVHDAARTQNPVTRSIDDALLLAKQIKKDLDSGASFIDQAIKYSEDPTVFQNEGKLDWITWGRTIPAFQNEAFLLKKGEYSHPVLTDFGYHIIFCEDIRPSKYASFSTQELEDVVYIVARNSISGQLAQAAAKYDSTQLANYNLKYNDKALELIMGGIQKQHDKNKISGQHKIDLINLFNNMTEVGVVAMLDDKGYGVKWFAERLKMVPSGRHPQIVDLSSLKQAFNILVLQFLAIQEGYKNKIDETNAYQKQIKQLYQSLLYDQYLRWLVNNASDPDSVDVLAYYNDNKDNKYLEQEKVSIREIKVLDKMLADSLLLELTHGANFTEIAKRHSKTNPDDGGKREPFTEGKYNQLGSTAFMLNVGEISEVITNLDRTYSIITLDEIIPPEYIPLNKVYNRIESIISRNNQKQAKENGLAQLRKKYNVIINKGFYSE